MKTVIFVRHAKSAWDYDVSDRDRPLKERGITDAHLVAQKLKSENIDIDFVFSSPANRALHTCMIFSKTLDFNLNKLLINNDLYDFSGQSVLDFIRRQNNDYKTILVFGHNYALTTLVNELGDKYIENVPTAGLVKIEFPIEDWSTISKGKTVQVIFPKELR